MADLGCSDHNFIYFVRFAVFFAVSDGFSGIAIAVPLFLLGGILFWLFMSVFFGAWVYQDCRKRGDDPVLWVIIIFSQPYDRASDIFLKAAGNQKPLPCLRASCTAAGKIL